jgi:prepilin-type N-terminal cleavage/methylation domain-containing protein
MKKSAFSLLELSVSLVVVSLLMAMVSQGIKIISSSRLTTARSLTSKSPVPNISGLIAWYETSSVDSFKTNEAFDGKQISAWYDISPNSIPAKKNALTRAASAAVTYESDGINKIPSLLFNGTNKIELANFYQGSTSQNTIFIVANPSTVTTTILDSYSSGSSSSIGQNSNSFSMNLGSLVSTGTVTNPIVNLAKVSYIAAVYFNGSNSKVYFNSSSIIAGGSTISPGTTALTGISIGANRSNASHYSGLISEIIIYNRPLQNQERKDVMGYLSKKYGILVTGL